MSTFANISANPYCVIKPIMPGVGSRSGGSQAAVGHSLLPGDPVRGISHAVHAAVSFARRSIETVERAIRERKRASMSARLIGHIAQVLTHRVDVKCGGARNGPFHRRDDLRK